MSIDSPLQPGYIFGKYFYERDDSKSMENEEVHNLEEIEKRLKRTIAEFQLMVMQRVKEATEIGDLELASRWVNLANSVKNIIVSDKR